MTDQKQPAEEQSTAPKGATAAGFSSPIVTGAMDWLTKRKKKDTDDKDNKMTTSTDAAAAPPADVQAQAAPPPAAAPAPPAAAPARTYRVKPGDTLWDIAVKFYGDGRKYPKISQANKIPDPNMINPGMELTIPN